MIRRHNFKQLLFLPLHLGLAAVGYGLCCWLFASVLGSIFENFEPQLPHSFLKNREIVTKGFVSLAILAATFEGWKLWSQGITDLPGILNEVSPHSMWGAGAGSARIDITSWSVEFRVILNLSVSGPLQLLVAWQRLRNWIPDTQETRAKVERWCQFAKAQKGWHPEALYADDETALKWLCLMGFLEYSPTKGLVAVRRS